ncbi:MAG TPA: oxidoreductase, partial [Reyranella sp.]|nr:oxidoreductase [Reyranella sp.]
MPLFRESGIVEDPWQKLDDDAPVPADGLVLVSFTRWREARAALLARRGPVGVALANTDPDEALASDTARLDLIALHFP